jgi:hypothetical protein
MLKVRLFVRTLNIINPILNFKSFSVLHTSINIKTVIITGIANTNIISWQFMTQWGTNLPNS